MPRVALTDKQRQKVEADKLAARINARKQVMGDGLLAYKRRNGLTDESMGEKFGLSEGSVSKLIHGKTVAVKTDVFWNLLEAAGLEVKQIERI